MNDTVKPVKKVLHTMRIASNRGDTPITWDVEDRVSVEAASDTFNRMVGQHMQAFGWKAGETDGQVIDHFDPELERIAILPRAVGG